MKNGNPSGASEFLVDEWGKEVHRRRQMASSYETEIVREIWNNETGERFEIGPDRDGTDCVEIRYRLDDGKIGNRITIPDGAVEAVACAIRACLTDIANRNKV